MGPPIIAGATVAVPKQGEPRRNKFRQRPPQHPTLDAVTTTRAKSISVFLIIDYSTGGAHLGGAMWAGWLFRRVGTIVTILPATCPGGNRQEPFQVEAAIVRTALGSAKRGAKQLYITLDDVQIERVVFFNKFPSCTLKKCYAFFDRTE